MGKLDDAYDEGDMKEDVADAGVDPLGEFGL
jgi:hypothetical protein